jgi:uncharacterized protein YkwD
VARRLATILPLVATMTLAGSADAVPLERLVAPPSVCPHQNDAGATRSVQERAMRCLTNQARLRAHRGRLHRSRKLDRSAGMKSVDIVRCDSFSHYACGRDFTYWIERVGFLSRGCWRAGENLAWGTGSYGTPGSIIRAWLRSPGHRRNILSPDFEQFGVGLDGGLVDGRRARVWTQHFGALC